MGPVAALLFVIALVAVGAQAQELEPRAYSNTPVGMNFAIAGYAYSDGGVVTDPSVPLTDGQVRARSAVFAYARALDMWGKSGKFDVVLPYSSASGSASFAGERRFREVSGFADPRFRLSVNFYGAPALSPADFAGYRQDLIIGASLLVTAPAGKYDGSKLLNIGTNRWSVKPEIGASKAFGALTAELAAGTTFYGVNHDYFGGARFEQDPIHSLQGHLVYSFRSGIWGALNCTYYTGGRTANNGVRGNDLQQNMRVGATLALPVDRHHSVKLYASTGVSARTGTDFDLFGIAWQYRWVGGL